MCLSFWMQALVCLFQSFLFRPNAVLSDGYHMQPDILALAAKVSLLATNDPTSFTLDDIKL